MKRLSKIDLKELACIKGNRLVQDYLKNKVSYMYINDSRGVPLRTYAALKLPKKKKSDDPVWLVVNVVVAHEDRRLGSRKAAKEFVMAKMMKSLTALAELANNCVDMKSAALDKFLKERITISPNRMATDKKTGISNIHGKLYGLNELHNLRASCRDKSGLLADINSCIPKLARLELEWIRDKINTRLLAIDSRHDWLRRSRD
jgi:hypothetical protein